MPVLTELAMDGALLRVAALCYGGRGAPTHREYAPMSSQLHERLAATTQGRAIRASTAAASRTLAATSLGDDARQLRADYVTRLRRRMQYATSPTEPTTGRREKKPSD